MKVELRIEKLVYCTALHTLQALIQSQGAGDLHDQGCPLFYHNCIQTGIDSTCTFTTHESSRLGATEMHQRSVTS